MTQRQILNKEIKGLKAELRDTKRVLKYGRKAMKVLNVLGRTYTRRDRIQNKYAPAS